MLVSLVHRGDGAEVRAGAAPLPLPGAQGGLCLVPAGHRHRGARRRPTCKSWLSCTAREREVLRLLDIPARPLVERERTYIAAWQDMGFDNEALRLAYEKTVMKKQSMDWGYMNGILRRWHEKGLHTVAAIQAGDRACAGTGAGRRPQGRTPQPGEERRVREDMERMRRLMEQMKREEE